MKVNGKEMIIKENQSLSNFLKINQFNSGFIAVARNGEIVPKPNYHQVILRNEDSLEIVRFVTGG